MSTENSNLRPFETAKRLELDDAELRDEELIATVIRWENNKQVLNERGNLDDPEFFEFIVNKLEDLHLPTPGQRLRTAMNDARAGLESRDDKDSLANLKKKRDSRKVIDALSRKGYEWIVAEDTPYVFDPATRRPLMIHTETEELERLIWREFGINGVDSFYAYLIRAMRYHAHDHGEQASLQKLVHYDRAENTIFWDCGDGRVLKVQRDHIEEIPNGQDGVMFVPHPRLDPWRFDKDAVEGKIREKFLNTINFVDGEDGLIAPDQLRLLFLVWMLSTPFRASLPTRPIVLATGPKGSGKSTAIEIFGQILYGGKRYVGHSVARDNEKKFWSTVTTDGPMVLFDNLHHRIGWLNEALAQVATGVEYSTPELYKTNKLAHYEVDALLAITSITPHFRDDDVAERLLIFHFQKLKETQLQGRLEIDSWVRDNRDALLSEIVKYCQWVLRAEEQRPPDTAMRLVDFVQFGLRVGAGLDLRAKDKGLDPDVSFKEQIDRIFRMQRGAQTAYAMEDNPIIQALLEWVPMTSGADQMLNSQRWVPAQTLFSELQTLAEKAGLRWRLQGPQALGHFFTNSADLVAEHFMVDRRTKRSAEYQIRFKEDESTGRLL